MSRPLAHCVMTITRRALRGALCLGFIIALGACSSDREFDAAVRANTVVAFDDYLRLHPDGSHAGEARTHLAALLEAREWERAHAAGNLDAYQQYLRGYPQGQHVREALSAIADLNMAALPSTEAGGAPGTVTPRGAARAPAGEEAVTHPAVQGAIARSAGPIESPLRPAPAPVVARAVAPKAAAPKVAAAPAPTPRTASPAVRAAAAAAPGVSIQLGAFSTQASAGKAWQKIAARYAELGARTPVIAPAKLADGRTVNRLQVSGFSHESAASMCSALAAAHDACLIVLNPGLTTN